VQDRAGAPAVLPEQHVAKAGAGDDLPFQSHGAGGRHEALGRRRASGEQRERQHRQGGRRPTAAGSTGNAPTEPFVSHG
jgi:hypothetical protein